MNFRDLFRFAAACAFCVNVCSFTAEDDAGAETVPLPDDPLPVVPAPAVPPKADPKADKKKKDKEKKKEKESEKPPEISAPVIPTTPITPAPVADTPPPTPTTPSTDPNPTPPVPTPPVVVTPPPDSTPVTVPVTAQRTESTRVIAPVVVEGAPAETIPLPAERPDIKPSPTDTAAIVQPEVSDEELKRIALTLESTVINAGQPAFFSLFGPDAYLRTASADIGVKDAFGREVFRAKVAVQDLPFNEGKPRQIRIMLLNPLCEQHTLQLNLTGPTGRAVQLSAPFTLAAAPRTWDDWLALVSLPPDAKGWTALQSLGIRGGMQYRLHAARREALLKARAPFFVENVSRHLFSRYHVEPGLWDKTLARMSDPANRTRNFREPSFCSPQFADMLAKEIQAHGEAYAKDPPIFYSLAAEPSTTRLAAAADFDFSPAALEEFQRWLERDIYGTVAAVNAAWGTNFKAWADVTPMTTEEARTRMADGVMNLSPWADFRDFQDYWFSKTLRDGGSFLRRFDPTARAGITGAMGAFAFGGWDWSRLSQSLEVVEAYDIGHARELWRDLAPGKPALAVLPLMETTDGPPIASDAVRTLWKFALEGGPRAALLWDDSGEGITRRTLLEIDGRPSALAETLAPHLKALDGTAGALLARSDHKHDGVAILYSPASIRVNWMLEAQRLHGAEWQKAWGADTSAERRESTQLRLRESWIKLLEDLGLGWRFISSRDVETKALLRPENGIRTLILPRAVALSDEEAAAIREFAASGGRVIADATCGRFDHHGRLRDKPALDELLQVDTTREPFAPEPVNPLEEIRLPAPEGAKLPPFLTRENMRRFAPVFSDAPRWLGAWRTPEYRRSPVLAIGAARGAFLNLDLTDYCRWRLQPDAARALAIRDVLGGLLFAEPHAASAIDWEASKLPAGTQVIWLQPRDTAGTRVLALRRNPQNRIHELGGPNDSNALFEKPEPFKLVLRKPARVLPLFPATASGAGTAGALQKENTALEGVLDPAAPVLFQLCSDAAPELRVTAEPTAHAGTVWTPALLAPVGTKSLLLDVTLLAPDNTPRPEYAQQIFREEAAVEIRIPFAFNDPPGKWNLVVRDLLHATELHIHVELTTPIQK